MLKYKILMLYTEQRDNSLYVELYMLQGIWIFPDKNIVQRKWDFQLAELIYM